MEWSKKWCVCRPLDGGCHWQRKFKDFKTSFETWLPTLAVPLLPHSSCLITKLRTSFSGSSFLRPPVCVLCRICRSHPKIMKKKSKSVNHRRVRRKRVQQQQLSSFRWIETKTTRRSCCRSNRKKLGKKKRPLSQSEKERSKRAHKDRAQNEEVRENARKKNKRKRKNIYACKTIS